MGHKNYFFPGNIKNILGDFKNFIKTCVTSWFGGGAIGVPLAPRLVILLFQNIFLCQKLTKNDFKVDFEVHS